MMKPLNSTDVKLFFDMNMEFLHHMKTYKEDLKRECKEHPTELLQGMILGISLLEETFEDRLNIICDDD